MRSRVLGAAAAVLLAALGTFVLVSYVRGAEERALAGERTVTVLVVSEAVERGTPASALNGMVHAEQVPAKVQAVGSVATLDELGGRVTAVDLVPGEQVVSTRFVAQTDLTDERPVPVPEGLQEVTISLEPQRAVGGQIGPGDTVGLLASFDPFDLEGAAADEDAGDAQAQADQTPNTTHLILHKLLVTNVALGQPQPEQAEDESAAPQLAPTDNLLVTLAVDAAQAEQIVFTAEFGRVWLTAEPADAVEDGTTIQTRGTIYR